MKISTRGRYALRMMLDIATNDHGEPVRIKDIAARQDISVKYLEQIVSVLTKAGYVKSIRGPQGAIAWQDCQKIHSGDDSPVDRRRSFPCVMYR